MSSFLIQEKGGKKQHSSIEAAKLKKRADVARKQIASES
jgi:hypothetical protein